MEVILVKDVKNLGFKNDIVAVKPGYALNYLLPQGLAKSATESAKKVILENQKQAEHKAQNLFDEAQKLSEELTARVFSVATKVGENGKIFGSINNIMLSKALADKGLSVDRHKISIKGHPKTAGQYEAEIDLHKEVKVNIQFEVVAED